MPPVVLSITTDIGGTPMPVTGGVDPEALITITGTGFDAAARVVANVSLFPDLQIHSQNASTIEAFIPSVRALETSPYYARNTIQMNLELTVENPDGTSSAANRFPVRLGPPRLGAPNQQGQAVTFGMADDTEETGEGTDALGSPAGGADEDGGEARWYTAAPALPTVDFGNLILTTPPADPVSGRIVLPAGIGAPLATARDQGTLLTATSWHDDGLTVSVPEEDGYVVVWRDDIPSASVHIVDLLPPGITCPDVPRLLNQAFQLNLPPQVPSPLPPGQLLILVAERVPAVSNALTTLIDTGQAPVRFGFRLEGIPDSDVHTTPNLGNQPQAGATDVVAALIRPELVAKEQPDPAPREFSVQLEVTVTIAPCGDITFDAGVALQLSQAPLGVSTIATFFEDSGFGGAPMVVTPRGTFIPTVSGNKFDHNNSGGLTNARDAVADELGTLAFMCQVLHVFAGIGGIPVADEIDLLGSLITKIRDASLAVVDGRGENNDLESAVVDTFWWRPDRDFDDEAGSMILVGVPGFGFLDGFADSGFGPTPPDEHWQMPDGHIVAAIRDFEQMRNPTNFGTTEIALPYADMADARNGDFDDEMGSFRFGQ